MSDALYESWLTLQEWWEALTPDSQVFLRVVAALLGSCVAGGPRLVAGRRADCRPFPDPLPCRPGHRVLAERTAEREARRLAAPRRRSPRAARVGCGAPRGNGGVRRGVPAGAPHRRRLVR